MRYTLILRDDVMYRLMTLATERKISVGKFLNRILNEYVASPQLDMEKRCCICGEPAKLILSGFTRNFFCFKHGHPIKKWVENWSEL